MVTQQYKNDVAAFMVPYLKGLESPMTDPYEYGFKGEFFENQRVEITNYEGSLEGLVTKIMSKAGTVLNSDDDDDAAQPARRYLPTKDIVLYVNDHGKEQRRVIEHDRKIKYELAESGLPILIAEKEGCKDFRMEVLPILE